MILPKKSLRKVLPERNPDEVPICERYTLSIPEAAQYFGIGQVRLRSIIHANPNADFLLMVGNRLQIKRKKFEAFIDDMSVV
ncbi:MAG: excisionase [Lachnospiraceae bacterium]|nr:excisionase [Lachnospiraceae bacterium]